MKVPWCGNTVRLPLITRDRLAQSTRPKQLRNREVPWEGSLRSKLMSRRTERPYQVDGTDQLAPHRAVRCSVPEINGPAVQQEFTSLLREACNPSLSATTGLAASNGGQAGAGVSRGHSTGSNEPGARHWPVQTKKPDALTTREGPNLAGRHDHRWSCPGSDAADWLSLRQRPPWQRKSAALSARTARNPDSYRGPACTMVWEPGEATLPATRLGVFIPQSIDVRATQNSETE